MKSRVSIVILVSVVLAIATGFFVWRHNYELQQRSRSFVRPMATQQVAAISKAVGATVKLEHKKLLQLVTSEARVRSAQKAYGVTSPMIASSDFDGFEAVGFVTAGQEGQGYQLIWAATNRNEWLTESSQLATMFSTMPLGRAEVNPQETLAVRTTDQSGRPYVAMFFHTDVKGEPSDLPAAGFVVGILPIQWLADINGLFKTKDAELAVIDHLGFTLAYPKQQYLGASLNMPAVSRVIESQNVADADFFRQGDDYAVGAYEKVKGTNLYVVVDWPFSTSAGAGSGFTVFGIILFLGLTLLGAALVWFFIGEVPIVMGGVDSSLMPMQPMADQSVPEQAVAVEPNEPDEPTINLKDDEIRMNVFRAVSAGLGGALTGPLNAILGQAQLARSESGADSATESAKKHFTTIEREARHARDLIENLSRSSAIDSMESKVCDLQDVTLKAIARHRKEFTKLGITIQKKLDMNAPVKVDEGLAISLIEELLKNAVDAVEESTEKKIIVQLEKPSDKRARLSLIDTGAGIGPDSLHRIFEPFFSTKGHKPGTGLGLTTAKMLMQNFGGEIFVESKVGAGTKLILEFPVVARDKKMVDVTEEFTTTSAPIPTKKDKQDPADLNVMEPLTGTKSDHLPTAPSSDEVTFVGELGLKAKKKNETKVAEPESKVVEVQSEPEPDLEPEVEVSAEPAKASPTPGRDDDEEFVEIRRPKIRAES